LKIRFFFQHGQSPDNRGLFHHLVRHLPGQRPVQQLHEVGQDQDLLPVHPLLVGMAEGDEVPLDEDAAAPGDVLGKVGQALRQHHPDFHRLRQQAAMIDKITGRQGVKPVELPAIGCGINLGRADHHTGAVNLEHAVLLYASLAEASQRLTRSLTEELQFLKALQSNGLTREFQDFFPVLRHAIQELLEIRFREKEIRVEINGQPLEKPCTPLVFAFEPYTMEVILQNILSNAMRCGDFIQVRVTAHSGRLLVEICDNGPGIDISAVKRNLVSAEERREAESTQLGLRVTLHLLEKCGGQLFALNKAGAGAAFILEFSQQPPGPR
jgi:signal transduction histidine kinase